MVLAFVGLSRPESAWSASLLTGGVVGLVCAAATAPLALLMHRLLLRLAATPTHRLEHLLQGMHHDLILSDNAKRVLFREREMQLLRHAIEEDIASGDYNAGLKLCDEMSNLFGFREESEAFRSRILQVRRERYEADVRAAFAEMERQLVVRDWVRAHQEAAKIRRLFPEPEIQDEVEQRLRAAREAQKQELEDRFVAAAGRHDVEEAMSLLKQLDRFLSRDEAGRFAQLAQEVVVKHRENLSTQFRLAVSDRRWAEAARIGDSIVREFPNTKMADEVRSMLDVIRTRATQAAVAASGI
jgi:hypothetical protein